MTDFAVPLIPATPAPQGPQDPQRPAWLQRALDDSDREAEKQQRAREQRTLGVFEAAMEESPYDAAALKVAAELTKKQEMLDLYANNPRLRQILDHLPTVRMLHDDLGNLKLVSGSMDWFRRSAEAGAAQNEAGFLKARQALARQNGGSLSAFEMDRLTEIEQMQKMAAADTGPFDTAANILGQMVGPAITATAVGLGSAGVASFGGPISSGAAFVWGSLSAAFTQTAITEFGHEYDKLYSELTEAGVSAEEAHDTALAMAAGYAVGSAAVETGALGIIGKPFVGAGKKLGAKILGLARPTGERAAAQFLKASALGFGAEVGEEGAQQLLDSFAQNLAGAKHGKDIGPDFAQTLRDAGQAMWQAAKGMAILAPLGPALHYAADLDQVRQAKVNAEGIQQLADAAKAAKMPPDVLKQVVDAQAGEGFEMVYIEGPRLAQGLEATGQTRAQLAHDLPDVAKQLEKAERTGDDVAIPIGDFAAKIARSDLYPAIQKSVRIGKNGWSIDRAKEWEAEREANQAATAKKVAEAAVKFVDWGAQADRVQARIETEIARHLMERQVPGVTKDQVRQYAILHRQHVEARAAEEGKTPEEWDNANKLTFPTVQAVDQPRPGALNQDTAETANAPDTRASLRGVGREDGGREEARYGTAREGASSVRAVHFSPEPRTILSGDAYGTGLPGAERRRVTGDPILSKRVHFYVDTGNGVVPEPGVGEHRHVAQLDNVYDTDKDPLGLVAAWRSGPSVDFSDLERAIVDAGFDGIFVPRAQGTQGVAVLLGPKHTAVPVQIETSYDEPRTTTGDEAQEGGLQNRGGVRGSPGPVGGQAGPQPDSPPLEGLPTSVEVDGRQVAFGPSADARAAAIAYMKARGLPYRPARVFAPVDVARAKRIAQAYEEMKHAPNDPQVRAAYEALAAETVAQFEAMIAAGVKVEFNPPGADPYPQPRFALLDLQENNHLFIFSTEDGYGQVGISDEERAANPLLQASGFKFGDRPALINDLFRAVHDYFGHFKEGVGFRARGEENAWQQHMAMFSPLARWAATSETRGQNSWVNFGPRAEANRQASGADTVYAEQKIGLLPEWVLTEGYLGDQDARGTLAHAGGLPLFQDTRGEFDPATNSVFLNPQANATTVLHEMSHFWLTTLFKAAGGLSSSVQTRKDAQTVLDWFGVKDLATWSALSLEQQRKHHEAWAYNAEAHFFGEGKAPSSDPEQVAMFRKFGRWIRAVYRQVRDKLNARYRANFGVDLPGLTPDVRAVFDRMVASEDAILAAKAERAGNPLLTEKPADMADQDWANYQEAQRAADDVAIEALQQASLKAMRWTANNGARVARAIQAKTRQARAEIEAQERARAEQEPVYRAIDQLRHGLVREGSTSRGPAFKLSLAGFRATPLGDEARVAMLGTGPSGMLSTTGLMPDVAAQLLGFETGEDLVRQLVRALEDAPLEVEVQRRTDARMLAEHSDLTDPQKVQRMIEEAIHNETRTKMVAAELKWLSQVNSPIQLMVRAARAYAQETIGETPVGKVRPHEHAQAEVRERRAAEKALTKGDRAAAASHKRRELIESQMEREALHVRGEQEKLEKLLRRVFKADKKLAATRNVDYVAVARYLASVFGLVDSERAPSSYIEKLQQYNPELFEKLTPQLERAEQWAEQARAEGRVVKTWKDLTVDEFRDLAETIGALWHQALREQQFAVGDEKKDLAEVAKEVTDRAMKLPPGKPTPVGALTPGESRGRGWARIKQLLYRPEHWAWRKDGGDDNGPFTRFFWRTIRAAVDAYGKARTVYTKRIAGMVRKLRPGLKQGLIEFRDTNGKLLYVFGRGNGGFGHAELVASLLHIGNLGNLKRLLVGRGWGTYDKETKILDTRNWDAFVSKMVKDGYITKDVMDFVQQLWDLNEEIKPIAQKAHRDLYGYYFDEVEAVQVTMPGIGVYRGGYMPAKLDRTARSAARIQSLSALEADFRKQFATTGRGFTQERVEDFAEPLLLDLDLVPAHVDDVLRFSFLQPAVRDVERLAKHPDVATVLDAQQPGVFENMLLPWLQRVASQSITKAGKSEDFDGFWRAVRSSVGISTMFANVGNALQQLTGLISATLKVGPRFLFKGMWRLLSERRGLLKDIASKSAFMAIRQNNQVYDSLEMITDLMQNRSKFAKLRAWVKQHAYFLQSGMQNLVDSVVWSGAYEQALAKAGKQVSDTDADADAVAQADAAVRMTQSSFEPTDVAHFEEGSPFYRVWTMFAGYFNTMANLQADQLVKIGNASGMGKAGVAFGAYALGFALPMLLADAITKTMRGQWEDDDDDGDIDVLTFEYLFLGQLRSAVAEVPVFGPTVGAFGLNQLDNEPWNDRMTTSPVVAAFERAFLGTKDSVQTALGLKVDRRGNPVTFQGEDIRDPLTLLGILFRIPLGAVGSRVGYGIDVATGATEASSGLDVARGLLTGVKSRQPK